MTGCLLGHGSLLDMHCLTSVPRLLVAIHAWAMWVPADDMLTRGTQRQNLQHKSYDSIKVITSIRVIKSIKVITSIEIIKT